MEFYENFVLNFTSLAAVVFTTIITGLTVIQKLKIRWPVKVNCWFCNNDSKIYRQQRDWWLCSFCEQYNGFSEDGDYNYDIPEQRTELTKNCVRYSEISAPKELRRKNRLCSQCNRNEEIKMSQLANFQPSSDKRYDSEMEIFKRSLEEKYRTCSKCSKVVQRVLSKQASWLLQYKMTFFKNKPIQNMINNKTKYEHMFRVLLPILNSAMLYDATFWPLSIFGLLLQLGACLTSPSNKQSLDMVAAFFWILIIILTPFNELKLLKTNLNNEWLAMEFITQYHVILSLTVIIGLMNLKSSSFTKSVKSTVSLKKLESPYKNIQVVPRAENIARMEPSFVGEKSIKSENMDTKHCRSPVNITNLLMTPVSLETPMPIKPTLFTRNSGVFGNDFMGTTLPRRASHCTTQNWSPGNLNSFSQPSFNAKHSLNESLTTLSSLSLSNKHEKQGSKIPKMFQTKIYDGASPDLFTKLNKSPNKKFVLSPPKLKSVTQASWVAGGYWQAGMDVPTLSRSSSQSSGFGSTGSNFVPSREPSVYNDFDRYSVVSDATQCCHMSRQNSVNSVTSCCRQSSAFSFPRPDSPAYNQFSRIPQNTMLVQNNMTSLQNYELNKYVENQTMPINMNSNNHIQAVPAQTIHTTILTNPVWLPALLCGSLVFNMIVLCTTLLR